MIDTLIAAERECTESVDINPDKVLRSVGFTYREWIESTTSTELPHWVTWEIVGYMQTFSHRQGNTLYYERLEEIRLKEDNE